MNSEGNHDTAFPSCALYPGILPVDINAVDAISRYGFLMLFTNVVVLLEVLTACEKYLLPSYPLILGFTRFGGFEE